MFLMSEIVTSNFFFFKQKTAYEMRISYWISGVCSSDLLFFWNKGGTEVFCWVVPMGIFTIIFSSICSIDGIGAVASSRAARWTPEQVRGDGRVWGLRNRTRRVRGDERLFEEGGGDDRGGAKSEEHTAELQSPMPHSHTGFCF